MPGFSRTRSYHNRGAKPGKRLRYDGVVEYSGRGYGTSKTTTDTLGNEGGQNTFSSSEKTCYDSYINGDTKSKGPNGKPYWSYIDYIPAIICDPPSFAASPITTGFKDVGQAISGSHPGDSELSLPNFLFELKDVPQMLRHAFERGRQLERIARAKSSKDVYRYLYSPKARAEDWLAYNFGYKPLVNDLMSIANLSDWVAKRLQRPSQIKRRRHLGTQTARGQNSTYIGNGLATRTSIVTTEKWVCTRWNVDRRYTEAMKESKLKAYSYALGLDVGLHTLWDAMPWSWLVDWFTGIGDVVHTYANKNGITFDSGVVMFKTTSESFIRPSAQHDGILLPDCYCRSVTKTRNYASPVFVPAFENLLSARQLATLSSLAVTRSGWK